MSHIIPAGAPLTIQETLTWLRGREQRARELAQHETTDPASADYHLGVANGLLLAIELFDNLAAPILRPRMNVATGGN